MGSYATQSLTASINSHANAIKSYFTAFALEFILATEFAHELGEDVQVMIDVGLRVLDRDRPLVI